MYFTATFENNYDISSCKIWNNIHYYPTVLVIVQKARETSTNIPRYCTVGYCAISKESHGVLELISNWRTNNSNLTIADLLRIIADSKFVSPSAEQKILNSGVFKDNSKVYLLP